MRRSFGGRAPLLHVQGALRNAAGPVDGTYGVTALLYTQVAGGTPVYTEGHPAVVATDGVFALTLGGSEALPLDVIDAAAELWVAVKVEGEPELPRARLGSVAYALFYKSGSATGGPTYPSSLPGSNPVGFKLAGKNRGGPTNWSGSSCGVTVDTYTATYTGSDFIVTIGAAATTASFQVAVIEGMASCTTSDNSGPATMDLYIR